MVDTVWYHSLKREIQVITRRIEIGGEQIMLVILDLQIRFSVSGSSLRVSTPRRLVVSKVVAKFLWKWLAADWF
jgi:hypothetical protein